jgi:hypothetical protein
VASLNAFSLEHRSETSPECTGSGRLLWRGDEPVKGRDAEWQSTAGHGCGGSLRQKMCFTTFAAWFILLP